jgi:oxygen-independent coproporphyrinogen-3 oxidase
MASMLTLRSDHFGLYVHIPFCARKCRYCDFASAPPQDGAEVEAYLAALAAEARSWHSRCLPPVTSIYIGGGTPSLLTGAQLRRLWATVIAPFPRDPAAEVTLEANPGRLGEELLAGLAALPVTRVSLGVQSLQAEELAILGRLHSPEQVPAAMQAVYALGISELNLDLMYGIPEQSCASWAASVMGAVALAPAHLSLYSLICEPGTPLTAQVEAGTLELPGEDEEDMMAAWVGEALPAAGYTLYEVANAARPGAVCRHNLGYWLGRDYLGLGVGAASWMGGVRWRNATTMASYLARLAQDGTAIDYCERLAAPDQLLERVMLGLRLTAGFDLPAAEIACGRTLVALVGDEYGRLCAEGALEWEPPVLRLSARAFRQANQVMARLWAAADRRSARIR